MNADEEIGVETVATIGVGRSFGERAIESASSLREATIVTRSTINEFLVLKKDDYQVRGPTPNPAMVAIANVRGAPSTTIRSAGSIRGSNSGSKHRPAKPPPPTPPLPLLPETREKGTAARAGQSNKAVEAQPRAIRGATQAAVQNRDEGRS